MASLSSDVWKPTGKGADERGGGRKIGENKLLSSKKKMKVRCCSLRRRPIPLTLLCDGADLDRRFPPPHQVMPYMVKDSFAGKNSTKAGSSSTGNGTSQCKKCSSRVAKVGAKYCQSCAYKDSLCAMCGIAVMSQKDKAQYKMTSK